MTNKMVFTREGDKVYVSSFHPTFWITGDLLRQPGLDTNVLQRKFRTITLNCANGVRSYRMVKLLPSRRRIHLPPHRASMIIIGAGMAGLIAANLLRRHNPVVYEAQKSLPNNHGALLRFRTDAVAKAVGQRFKQVYVTKAVKWKGAVGGAVTLQASNLYSRKVTGEVLERSIMNLEPSVRWIAPDSFCEDLAKGVNVKFGCNIAVVEELLGSGPVVSTIPMPSLMTMNKWDNAGHFSWKEIWSIRARIRRPVVNVYQTIYYPDPEIPFYRASITGDMLIIEFMETPREELINFTIRSVLTDFGINSKDTDRAETEAPTISYQKYGKLLPYPERERRAFILAMTDRYGIYSLGRFATWRQILLDDLVQDVGIIDRLITERDAYSRHLM